MRIRGSELRKIIKEEITRQSLREQDSTETGSEKIQSLLSGKSVSTGGQRLDADSPSVADGHIPSELKRQIKSGPYDYVDIPSNGKIKLDGKIWVTVTPEDPSTALLGSNGRKSSPFFITDSGMNISHIDIEGTQPGQIYIVPPDDYRDIPAGNFKKLKLEQPVNPGTYQVDATLTLEIQSNKLFFSLRSTLDFPIVFPDERISL